MYKHTVECVDYNGNPYTEDLYFNLSKAEIAELELAHKEGLEKTINKMVEEENTPEMASFFKNLLLKSYGKKSEDGRRFIKSDELVEAFVQSDAYSEFFYLLLSDENVMEAFTTNVLPSVKDGQLVRGAVN